MKITLAARAVTLLPLLTGGAAGAQGGTMMEGHWGERWMGGYGFPWVPVLVTAVVVALIVWLIRRNGK